MEHIPKDFVTILVTDKVVMQRHLPYWQQAIIISAAVKGGRTQHQKCNFRLCGTYGLIKNRQILFRRWITPKLITTGFEKAVWVISMPFLQYWKAECNATMFAYQKASYAYGLPYNMMIIRTKKYNAERIIFTQRNILPYRQMKIDTKKHII